MQHDGGIADGGTAYDSKIHEYCFSKFYTGLPEDCRLMPGCSAATLHKVQLSRDEILIDFELQTKCVFWLETYGHETYILHPDKVGPR